MSVNSPSWSLPGNLLQQHYHHHHRSGFVCVLQAIDGLSRGRQTSSSAAHRGERVGWLRSVLFMRRPRLTGGRAGERRCSLRAACRRKGNSVDLHGQGRQPTRVWPCCLSPCALLRYDAGGEHAAWFACALHSLLVDDVYILFVCPASLSKARFSYPSYGTASLRRVSPSVGDNVVSASAFAPSEFLCPTIHANHIRRNGRPSDRALSASSARVRVRVRARRGVHGR